MAKDYTAGAQQQAGDGGPVKSGSAAAPNSGNAASHAAAVLGAHTSASAPGTSLATARRHSGA